MSLRVRVVVPARNEQQRIGKLLQSVRRGLAFAPWQSECVVVLDRCHDQTEAIARAHGARALCSAKPGKVEALRAGMRDADVYVCVDADVVVGERTLFDLVRALEGPVLATCPPLAPAPSHWHTPLSWALYRYNAARGFSSERLWLSGRCYAVREIEFPAQLQADDIWLSRALLARDPRAILHVQTDPVTYLPPRTLRGMSRTYRRLRRELARIDRLYPELPSPGRDRRIDSVHGIRDLLALNIFQAALQLCRMHAVAEDFLHEHLAYELDSWPVIHESKR